MSEQKIELSLALVNHVLEYLASRPYGEVFQLIKAIQGQAAAQVEVSAEAPSEPAA